METGWSGAAAGQRLTAAGTELPLAARHGRLSRRRWLAAVLVLLAAFCVAATGVALTMDLLAASAVTLLAACAAGLAMLSILMELIADRSARQQFQALLRALEASERNAEALREQRAWLAGLSASLQQAGNPAELAQRLLSGLARGLPIQQGLCCYWSEQGQHLIAAARYGGEGTDADGVLLRQPLLAPLLLEAVRSGREIVIAKPGSAYLRISSGLGDAEPAELLVLPLEHRGRLFAVLELAALQPLGEAARALIAEVVPIFAMCLEILLRAESSTSSSGQPAARPPGGAS